MEPTFARLLGPDDEGRRLDRIVRKAFPGLPLSALHKALRTGRIKVDGKTRKPDYLCDSGELLEAYGIEPPAPPPVQAALKGSSLPEGSIILETRDLLFINKPIGLLAHDGADSLAGMVERYLQGLNENSLSFRPGPLHRLDRNTSGLIAFSRTLRGAREFSLLMRESRIRKTYLAILEGEMGEAQTWEDFLERDEESRISRVLSGESAKGRTAVTRVSPVISARGVTFAKIALETGRTHQIRAQAQAHAYPLAGDVKYGGKPRALPYYLHSWRLELGPSELEGIPRAICAPMPDYFNDFLVKAGVAPENTVYSYLYKSDHQEEF